MPTARRWRCSSGRSPCGNGSMRRNGSRAWIRSLYSYARRTWPTSPGSPCARRRCCAGHSSSSTKRGIRSARLWCWSGWPSSGFLNRQDEALDTVERGLALLPADQSSPERAALLAAGAKARMLQARYADAAERARAALDAAQQLEDGRAIEVRALNSLGIALAGIGDFESGASALRDALARSSDDSSLIHERNTAFTNLADLLSLTGRAEEGLAVARQGLENALPASAMPIGLRSNWPRSPTTAAAGARPRRRFRRRRGAVRYVALVLAPDPIAPGSGPWRPRYGSSRARCRCPRPVRVDRGPAHRPPGWMRAELERRRAPSTPHARSSTRPSTGSSLLGGPGEHRGGRRRWRASRGGCGRTGARSPR